MMIIDADGFFRKVASQTIIELMGVFFEIHSGLPREAPGDAESTERAYRLLTGIPTHPRILEIACGPGTTAVQLAELSGGTVVVIDLHMPFLHAAARLAASTGFAERLYPVRMSMHELGLAGGRFDIVWSEGAIYITGFENGLHSWRRLLKPGGALAVTEATWLTSKPPEAAAAFWKAAYPEMQDIPGNLAAVHRQGYRLLDHFTLPAAAWWSNYYYPLDARLTALRRKYAADPQALAFLDEEAAEIELYRKFGDSYGYVFYVMQRED